MSTPLAVALDLDWDDLGPEQAVLSAVDVRLLVPDELRDDQLERVVALLTAGGINIDGDFMRRYPNLRIVAIFATGYDAVDLDAARELGVAVTNVGGYCTEEVADHTLALALTLVRQLDSLRAQASQGRWLRVEFDSLRRSANSIWGVVGFGRIGRAVARRAAGFGFAVWACDPQLADAAIGANGARPAALDELLHEADVISVHAARTGHDDQMLDRRRLALLKPTAYLISVARGAFIDEDAIADALDAGQLAGAAFDVLADEPPDPGNRLVGHARTIITPHAAWYSDAAEAELRARGIGNVIDVLSDTQPADLVPELR